MQAIKLKRFLPSWFHTYSLDLLHSEFRELIPAMKSRSETLQSKQTAYQGQTSVCWGSSLRVLPLFSWFITETSGAAHEFWPGRGELWLWGVSARAEGNQQVPCWVWGCLWGVAGQEGEQHPLQAHRIARKAHKNGFEFSLDVPRGFKAAWICLAQPTTSNKHLESKELSWLPAGKEGSAFCCTLKLSKCLYQLKTGSWGRVKKTGMNFQAETSAAKF